MLQRRESLRWPASLTALDALTRRHAAGEAYEAFIDLLSGNALARRVKLADLADNMNVTRLAVVDEAARERLERYRWAWSVLEREGT
jgi:hypothetical protein